MKKITLTDQLNRRASRAAGRFERGFSQLSPAEMNERGVQLWRAGYDAGQLDYRKKLEKQTGRTRRGVELCPTCGFSVNAYAHSEICGV